MKKRLKIRVIDQKASREAGCPPSIHRKERVQCATHGGQMVEQS